VLAEVGDNKAVEEGDILVGDIPVVEDIPVVGDIPVEGSQDHIHMGEVLYR